MVKFRKMEKEDIQLVLSLGLTSLHDGGSFASLIESYDSLDHNTYKFYVAEKDGFVIGHLSIMVTLDCADILFLFVQETERKNGVASYMLRQLEKTLEFNKVPKMMLEVRKSNLVAQRTYVTNGFLMETIRYNYYSNGEDAYIMLKKVGGSYW